MKHKYQTIRYKTLFIPKNSLKRFSEKNTVMTSKENIKWPFTHT